MEEYALWGFLAGAIATAPMTMMMVAAFYYLPENLQYPLPPKEIVTEIASKAEVKKHLTHNQLSLITLFAHFGYGGFCGAIFGILSPWLIRPFWLSGIFFCLGVWFVSYMIGLPVLNILKPATRHPARRNVLMIGAHIVWGAALGIIFEWF